MQPTNGGIYVKLLLTAAFWGGTWVAGRVAVQEAEPFAVASWRFLFATVVLGALVVAREGWPRWNRPQWFALVCLGCTGVFLYNVFFLFGLRSVEAGRGALVVALTPVIVAVGDRWFFGAPLPLKKVLGVCVALIGCLLVLTQGALLRVFGGAIQAGEWLLLLSVVSWASYTLIIRHSALHFSPLAMAFGSCFVGWILLTAIALAEGSLLSMANVTWRGWSSIAFLGVMGTAVAYTWYAQAIHHIGLTRASAFSNLVPVFAVLFGAVLLGERLGWSVLFGGGLVLCGVVLTNHTRLKKADAFPLTQ